MVLLANSIQRRISLRLTIKRALSSGLCRHVLHTANETHGRTAHAGPGRNPSAPFRGTSLNFYPRGKMNNIVSRSSVIIAVSRADTVDLVNNSAQQRNPGEANSATNGWATLGNRWITCTIG